eukprot:TRINITY_DN9880_c0_g1_i1.p1 TRINITY_DN9880_c0_g1~~TRINITY_DN9880_c0_g1_i1.p1  ORF type:complete len:951 (+),score=224.20 TRINITY_DN9880_c0_g1_i1:94-2853(+)
MWTGASSAPFLPANTLAPSIAAAIDLEQGRTPSYSSRLGCGKLSSLKTSSLDRPSQGALLRVALGASAALLPLHRWRRRRHRISRRAGWNAAFEVYERYRFRKDGNQKPWMDKRDPQGWDSVDEEAGGLAGKDDASSSQKKSTAWYASKGKKAGQKAAETVSKDEGAAKATTKWEAIAPAPWILRKRLWKDARSGGSKEAVAEEASVGGAEAQPEGENDEADTAPSQEAKAAANAERSRSPSAKQSKEFATLQRLRRLLSAAEGKRLRPDEIRGHARHVLHLLQKRGDGSGKAAKKKKDVFAAQLLPPSFLADMLKLVAATDVGAMEEAPRVLTSCVKILPEAELERLQLWEHIVTAAPQLRVLFLAALAESGGKAAWQASGANEQAALQACVRLVVADEEGELHAASEAAEGEDSAVQRSDGAGAFVVPRSPAPGHARQLVASELCEQVQVILDAMATLPAGEEESSEKLVQVQGGKTGRGKMKIEPLQLMLFAVFADEHGLSLKACADVVFRPLLDMMMRKPTRLTDAAVWTIARLLPAATSSSSAVLQLWEEFSRMLATRWAAVSTQKLVRTLSDLPAVLGRADADPRNTARSRASADVPKAARGLEAAVTTACDLQPLLLQRLSLEELSRLINAWSSYVSLPEAILRLLARPFREDRQLALNLDAGRLVLLSYLLEEAVGSRTLLVWWQTWFLRALAESRLGGCLEGQQGEESLAMGWGRCLEGIKELQEWQDWAVLRPCSSMRTTAADGVEVSLESCTLADEVVSKVVAREVCGDVVLAEAPLQLLFTLHDALLGSRGGVEAAAACEVVKQQLTSRITHWATTEEGSAPGLSLAKAVEVASGRTQVECKRGSPLWDALVLAASKELTSSARIEFFNRCQPVPELWADVVQLVEAKAKADGAAWQALELRFQRRR